MKKKFEVFINSGAESIKFAQLDTDIEAIQLALALHQSCNCEHDVCVYAPSGEKIVDVFTPKNDA